MPNRINYQLEMEKVLRTLDGTRPKLLLHACCAPCSSATLERLAAHFDITILYYNPNIYPPEEYHRREAELERFVKEAGYHYPAALRPAGVLHRREGTGERAGEGRTLHGLLPASAGTGRPLCRRARL